ncbi:hypothetical protein DRQ50_07550 [bacterium]|nr:MAG: hypothetical protein DRQ50_07550 [bacterium]
MNQQPPSKHDQVLFHLVVNLQMMAMQQLGKIQDPATGESTRDLNQAAGTIDILEMLKEKCRTGTPEEITKVMDQVVMDLQLNYMDELKQDHTPQDDTEAGPATAEKSSTADEPATETGTPQGEDEACDN